MLIVFLVVNTYYFGRFFSFLFYKLTKSLRFKRFCTFLLRLRMDLLGKYSGITPTLKFEPNEKQHCYEIKGHNVVVMGGKGNHDHGSSKVKLKNIVDYKWEQKNYPGRLIAVHNEGKFIAYAIKVNNRAIIEGMVRVVCPELSQRSLIKGLSNEVLDLQFAHISSQVILAIIEQTALHVHRIETVGDKISCQFLLKIDDPLEGHIPKYDRISWCPYLPEKIDEIDEKASQSLVWTRGNVFQCYSVSQVIKAYGVGDKKGSDIKDGCVTSKENCLAITCASYSADGSTLAVSSEDGRMRFYQVYFAHTEEKPRCLHEWKPHGGRPINGFFFLDNYSQFGVEQTLWKNVVTFADNNTEIKIWSCETWECLQTIKFKSSTESALVFKVDIDRTSNYLVLSDMMNRELYVLQVRKDSPESTITNGQNDESSTESSENGKVDKPTKAYIHSIAEFPLSSPILSFGILDAAVRKYKCGLSDNYLIDELDDYEEENNSLYCVAIHMFVVQPKSVQECHVLYQPMIKGEHEVRSTLSGDSSDYKDVSITSITVENKEEPKDLSTSGGSNIIASSPKLINSPAGNQTQKINLMTPDSFNSPAAGSKTTEGETVSQEVLSTLKMLAQATTKPPTSPNLQKSLENMNVLDFVNNKVIEEEQQQSRKSTEIQNNLLEAPAQPPMPSAEMLASGGSSPSREVQTILSLRDAAMNDFYVSDDILLDDTDGITADNDDDELNDLELEINDDVAFLDEEEPIILKKEELKKPDWPTKVPEAPKMTQHTELIAAAASFPPTNTQGSHSTQIKQYDAICHKMDQIVDLLQTQTCEILDLRRQVHDLQKEKQEEHNRIQMVCTKLESKLCNVVEEHLVRYERVYVQKMDQVLAMHDKRNQSISDTILQKVPQSLIVQISDQFRIVFSNAIKQNILPAVLEMVNMKSEDLQKEVRQKMNVTEGKMQDYMRNFFTSPVFVDSFSQSLSRNIKSSYEAAHNESVRNVILPGYERMSQELFKQLHQTFIQGTKDYTLKLEQYLAQYKANEDRSNEIVDLIRSTPSKISSEVETSLKRGSTATLAEVNKDLKALQLNLMRTVREQIKTEIEKGFEQQASSLEDSVLSVVRSQAQTPAPSNYDIQEQIKSLLASGQINKAFHKALLSNDLNLVEFTLEKADYKTVFNPCPLEQTVLLSLIQQIGADMQNHNELKHRYLTEALISLNFSDPITKVHAPKVMQDLNEHCQNYLTKNIGNSLCTNVKMVIIAIHGLGFK